MPRNQRRISKRTRVRRRNTQRSRKVQEGGFGKSYLKGIGGKVADFLNMSVKTDVPKEKFCHFLNHNEIGVITTDTRKIMGMGLRDAQGAVVYKDSKGVGHYATFAFINDHLKTHGSAIRDDFKELKDTPDKFFCKIFSLPYNKMKDKDKPKLVPRNEMIDRVHSGYQGGAKYPKTIKEAIDRSHYVLQTDEETARNTLNAQDAEYDTIFFVSEEVNTNQSEEEVVPDKSTVEEVTTNQNESDNQVSVLFRKDATFNHRNKKAPESKTILAPKSIGSEKEKFFLMGQKTSIISNFTDKGIISEHLLKVLHGGSVGGNNYISPVKDKQKVNFGNLGECRQVESIDQGSLGRTTPSIINPVYGPLYGDSGRASRENGSELRDDNGSELRDDNGSELRDDNRRELEKMFRSTTQRQPGVDWTANSSPTQRQPDVDRTETNQVYVPTQLTRTHRANWPPIYRNQENTKPEYGSVLSSSSDLSNLRDCAEAYIYFTELTRVYDGKYTSKNLTELDGDYYIFHISGLLHKSKKILRRVRIDHIQRETADNDNSLKVLRRNHRQARFLETLSQDALLDLYGQIYESSVFHTPTPNHSPSVMKVNDAGREHGSLTDVRIAGYTPVVPLEENPNYDRGYLSVLSPEHFSQVSQRGSMPEYADTQGSVFRPEPVTGVDQSTLLSTRGGQPTYREPFFDEDREYGIPLRFGRDLTTPQENNPVSMMSGQHPKSTSNRPNLRGQFRPTVEPAAMPREFLTRRYNSARGPQSQASGRPMTDAQKRAEAGEALWALGGGGGRKRTQRKRRKNKRKQRTRRN